MADHHLVSHHLCPYVQRVAIALAERNVAFTRTDIDLANKPQWFLDLSPLGKVPLLQSGGRALFESAAILEYLEETEDRALHPADPWERAVHRGWMEFGSAMLNTIAGVYNAGDAVACEARRAELRRHMERLEGAVGEGPWFAGARFSLVDAVIAPVFRYFEVFEALGLPSLFDGLPKVSAWRDRLMLRPSVVNAVAPDYPQRLASFLRARPSHMARLIGMAEAA